MSLAPQTRRSLLLRLGEHSDDAWIEFLGIYENAILRYCRAMGLQDADARDATQDVLAAVHAKISTWNHDSGRGSFRAWLFRVARNIAIDAITARARRRTKGTATEIDRALADVRDPAAESATVLDIEYRRALFEWAATHVRAEVRDATWQAFDGTAVRGEKPETVAARLGMTVGSVYTAKCRVVARIRGKVAQFDDAVFRDAASAAEARHPTRDEDPKR